MANRRNTSWLTSEHAGNSVLPRRTNWNSPSRLCASQLQADRLGPVFQDQE